MEPCPPCYENPPLPYDCPLSDGGLWTYEEELDASGQPILDIYSTLELEIFNLVNRERSKRGICPLGVDVCVFNVARLHSEDMAENNYFSHCNAAGEFAWERLSKETIPITRCGENLGKSTVNEADIAACIVEAWIKSKNHRKNMLDCQYTHTGIGVAYGGTGCYFLTQVFTTY